MVMQSIKAPGLVWSNTADYSLICRLEVSHRHFSLVFSVDEI